MLYPFIIVYYVIFCLNSAFDSLLINNYNDYHFDQSEYLYNLIREEIPQLIAIPFVIMNLNIIQIIS